ncbi:C40 family peptidase [Maribacter polysiphoniae]|uniref:C40 family peptidase n=1 Tax=Maribacter polysiphoniae TaxID=429344 RepID=A0A316EMP4_9FLAO|nr:C40 family peptidase [Maribacter polysiphoniae]MBD1260611.1 C40 family peptidase [Maribacter polysiphoniae]PWK24260.1 NlpC/P60 family protein [Maribacter polysiphoniae]
MQYGICHLSIVPIRSSAEETAEMVSQLLYGEHYKVLEQRKHWSRIRTAFDKCEGWIQNLQLTFIEETLYDELTRDKSPHFTIDLVSYIEMDKNNLLPIVLGSVFQQKWNHIHEGALITSKQEKPNLINTALQYLNTPYLWGGKTPFGIDAAGFTQMVYKINGYHLLRNATAQATQGSALSFIEESEAGDLAFFDNNEGVIDHVGIIMENNYIIHVHGKVRIDRLDHTGIFNYDTKTYTHQLRVIKKII